MSQSLKIQQHVSDHFVGRVYDWPVSKEQFNHLLNQIDKLNKRIEELENRLQYYTGWKEYGP